MRARRTEVDVYGPLVIGVDPARFGQDRTAIIRRQGRKLFGLERYVKKDTMEIVGIVHRIIINEKPDKVFIDIGGLGAGIVDRLHELGYKDLVVGVNSGSTPLDQQLYLNKRSEMWGEFKQWLENEPVQIPDNDELHADICSTRYKYDSLTRLVMEPKADMKKRGIRSSDCFIAGTLIHTPRGKIPIELLKVGDYVITPFGKSKVIKNWESETEVLTKVEFSNGSNLTGKGSHKIFNWTTGSCSLDALSLTFEVEIYSKWRMFKWGMLRPLITREKNTEFKQLVDIINWKNGIQRKDFFIELFGLSIMERYRKVMLYIIRIITGETMTYQTSKLCTDQNMQACIKKKDFFLKSIELKTKSTWIMQESKHLNGMDQKKDWNGIKNTVEQVGLIENLMKKNVKFVKKLSQHSISILHYFVQKVVNKKGVMLSKKLINQFVIGVKKSFLQINTGKFYVVPSRVHKESVPMTKVYNLTLQRHNVYYANDILVFNCADAAGLTFAYPVTALISQDKKSADKAKSIMASFKKAQRLRENMFK